MLLNLQILKDELFPIVFDSHYTDPAVEFTCVAPRPYKAISAFKEQFVYVAYTEDLPSRPRISKGHPSLISIGQPPQAYFDGPFNLLVTDDEISVMEIFDRCLDIFAKYEKWNNDIQQVIDQNGSLHEIGDLSEPLFDNPLYLQGSNFKCLFHVTGNLSRLSSEQYQEYLKGYGGSVPLADNSYLPAEIVNHLVNDPFYHAANNADSPMLYDWSKNFRNLYCNIGIHDHYTARLVVDEFFHPFTDRDFALTAILAKHLGKALRGKDQDLYNRPMDLDLVMASLLSHIYLKESRILSLLKDFRWNMDDTFFCMIVEPAIGNKEWTILKTIAIQLAGDIPSECYSVFDGQIVFVFNLEKAELTQEDVTGLSVSRLREDTLSAGISGTFTDFRNLFHYYNQARSALSHGKRINPDAGFYHYENYLLDDLLSRSRGKRIIEAFYPKGLRLLIEHDKKTGSNLVNLLKVYLECNLSVTETVRKSFIHRNTCIRHIKRIKEISGLNFDDPRIRLELGIVFAMIEEDPIASSRMSAIHFNSRTPLP